MFNNCVLRPDRILNTDFDQPKSGFHGTTLYLKHCEILTSLWRAWSGLGTHFFSVTTLRRRWHAAWENPLVWLWCEHNVPAQKVVGHACQGIWGKGFDQLGRWTVFLSSSQPWNHRLLLANILTGEAANNCLHPEAENQIYPCWTNTEEGWVLPGPVASC